jgi:hypothetical protein
VRHHAPVTPTRCVSGHGALGIPRSPANTQYYASIMYIPRSFLQNISINLANNAPDTWHCLRYYRQVQKPYKLHWDRKNSSFWRDSTQSKVKVTLSLCLTKHHATKTYGGVEVELHALLTRALDGREWSASCRCRLYPGKESQVPIGYEAGWAPSI